MIPMAIITHACPDCEGMNTIWIQTIKNPNTKKIIISIGCEDCDDIKEIVKDMK